MVVLMDIERVGKLVMMRVVMMVLKMALNSVEMMVEKQDKLKVAQME